MAKKRFTYRYHIVTALLILGILFIFARLVDLQILRHEELTEQANRQYHMTIELEARRGDVFDRNENAFATTLVVQSSYAVPRIIPEGEKAILVNLLSKGLSLKKSFVRSRLDKDRSFVWMKRKLTGDEAKFIRDLKHPAIQLMEEPKRFYPGGSLLAQILGFCNIDNKGLEGLELYMNKTLQGKPGYRKSKRDAKGREVKALVLEEVPPVHGNDVILNVQQFIQYVVERELDKAYKQWNAKGGIAIVMDPHSGQVLAMASRPTYDLNDLHDAKADAKRSRGITDVFEPGSIFKVVTAAAALNEGVVSMRDTFFCENGEYRYPYARRVIHDVHAYGELTFPQVIEKSSNIGTVKIAMKLGEEKLYKYIRSFGFGSATNIDFPGEVNGIVHPLDKWSKVSITSVPYGQEVAATAIQMLNALNVIANGGELMRPYIVNRVRDKHGVVIEHKEPKVIRRVISPKVADTIRDIMVQVVEKGTGKNAQVDGVKVGGKTGTSQKILPTGGYSHSEFVSSFIGFAPADKPLFTAIIVLDEARPQYYGGVVAAPVFKAIAEDILPFLGHSVKKDT